MRKEAGASFANVRAGKVKGWGLGVLVRVIGKVGGVEDDWIC